MWFTEGEMSSELERYRHYQLKGMLILRKEAATTKKKPGGHHYQKDKPRKK